MKINKILPEKSLNNLWIKIKELTQKVEECFQSVSNGKALVASAITDKKITTDANATFETMANNIRALKLGSGNATTGDVLSGKTFTNSDGVEYTGTMTNQGAKTASLNCGGSYTIPAGYHNGSGKVTANSLASQTSATAAAADIASGKTAWVNGKKITGTRPAAVKTASGTVNLSVPKESTKSTIVNFPTPFESIPTVTAVVDHAIQNGVADIVSRAVISTSQIKKSSFVLSIKNTTSATLECKASWSAQA